MADWHHAPLHRLGTPGAYFVTASTLHRAHIFHSSDRLQYLTKTLQVLSERYEIELEAWAIFSNHYHLVARPHGQPESFARFFQHLHADTAREANRWDAVQGRKVWFQYRDTSLTYPKSYLARLAYVMRNPVKHGLVQVADQYRFCSASWFEQHARGAQRRMLADVKCDLVSVEDDFEVVFQP